MKNSEFRKSWSSIAAAAAAAAAANIVGIGAVDFDNDGMDNYYEYLHNLKPNQDDSLLDFDNDGFDEVFMNNIA